MSHDAYDKAKDDERRGGEDSETRISPEVWDMATRRSGPHAERWRSVQEIANHAYLQGLIDGAEAITNRTALSQSPDRESGA